MYYIMESLKNAKNLKIKKYFSYQPMLIGNLSKLLFFQGSKTKIFGTYADIRGKNFGAADEGKCNFQRFLMRKFIYSAASIVILIGTLTLGGCFNFTQKPEVKAPTDERSRIVDDSEFSIKIPREWDIIAKKDFTNDVPQNTLMVFRNNVKNENFTANVNILKNNLLTPKETLEYAKEVINRQKTGLYNYLEILLPHQVFHYPL